MSTLKVLKEYLVGEGGYLLNDDNNGKTVMLSGAWGSGKTHFWQNDIRPQLPEKQQKNIYISLYGKESIGELKFEVLRKAYNLEVKEDFISKTASMISSIAPSFGEKSLVDGYDKLNKAAKEKQAEEILKSGSIICLDDFERKSSKIDLNDLFGYISQLALDYNCKVVIILNSDVFEGEEANVFKTVKEKTVNKYFYFEPTVEELFESIYNSDEKYRRLDDYKDKILSAIKETEELNARIYIQVLDNCLEWVDKGYGALDIRTLVLVNINFLLNHIILNYEKIQLIPGTSFSQERGSLKYKLSWEFPTLIRDVSFLDMITNNETEYIKLCKETNEHYLIDTMKDFITKTDKNGNYIYSQALQEEYLTWMNKNKKELYALWKYGYKLYSMNDISEEIYIKIFNFIKNGIISQNKVEGDK